MEHEHDTDANLPGTTYPFYQHEDTQYQAMPYAQPHLPYQVVPNAQAPDMLQMRGLSLMPHQGYPQSAVYPSPGIPPVSPTRTAASMQLPPSPSPAEYDHPISPPVSGSDTSNDSHSQTHYQHAHTYSRESSSGAGSPPSGLRGSSLVHRSQHRYHPASAPALKSRRRRSSTNDEHDFSDDGDQDGGGIGISPQSTGMSGQHLAETLANSRKEATRRQRIEAEQRRRDELREGYARLKDVLPVSNQKSSKVSLLERATNYIAGLDQNSKIIHARLTALEDEVARLREINERLSLTVAQHTGHMPDMDLGMPAPDHLAGPNLERPLSPPPDIHPHAHQQSHLHSHSHSHPHAPQPQSQPQPQQHETMYHNRTDSSASGSQASGSEY